tara:strand:+ start:746 stop:1162 length:417 start_codon:yes stop_codon:yes gene_type:complete
MRDSVRRIYPQVNTPRETLLKEFEKIMANDRNRFTSNPSKAFLVPENWTGEPMKFTLIRDNDECFVYSVEIRGEYPCDYYLYYWKKRCLNQELLNIENHCSKHSQWTDTMSSSRTGNGGYNPIFAILQEIGINTAETI